MSAIAAAKYIARAPVASARRTAADCGGQCGRVRQAQSTQPFPLPRGRQCGCQCGRVRQSAAACGGPLRGGDRGPSASVSACVEPSAPPSVARCRGPHLCLRVRAHLWPDDISRKNSEGLGAYGEAGFLSRDIPGEELHLRGRGVHCVTLHVSPSLRRRGLTQSKGDRQALASGSAGAVAPASTAVRVGRSTPPASASVPPSDACRQPACAALARQHSRTLSEPISGGAAGRTTGSAASEKSPGKREKKGATAIYLVDGVGGLLGSGGRPADKQTQTTSRHGQHLSYRECMRRPPLQPPGGASNSTAPAPLHLS